MPNLIEDGDVESNPGPPKSHLPDTPRAKLRPSLARRLQLLDEDEPTTAAPQAMGPPPELINLARFANAGSTAELDGLLQGDGMLSLGVPWTQMLSEVLDSMEPPSHGMLLDELPQHGREMATPETCGPEVVTEVNVDENSFMGPREGGAGIPELLRSPGLCPFSPQCPRLEC